MVAGEACTLWMKMTTAAAVSTAVNIHLQITQFDPEQITLLQHSTKNISITCKQ